MKKKEYKCNSFNIYTIKTDKFKTAHLEVIFRKTVDPREMPEYSFLASIMTESTKNYPTRRSLITKLEELYRTSIYGTTVRTGNVLNTNFVLDFINPEYINEEDYLENVIKIFFEVINNPNVTNDEFDLKQFNIVKEQVKKEIDSFKENPFRLSVRKAFNLMDPSMLPGYSLTGTYEELDTITPASLYQRYKKLFKDNTCDIFVIGNIDMDYVAQLIKKYFYHRYINDTKLSLQAPNMIRKKPIKGSSTSSNVQTNLVMIFNTCDLTDKERTTSMHVFNYLFGNGGLKSKLYQVIREQNSLCYEIQSMYLKYDDLLVVHIALEDENTDKAISLVKKCLKDMAGLKFSDDDFLDAKENLGISIDLIEDSNIAILNNYVFNIFDDFPDPSVRKEMLKGLEKEEVATVAKKIKLNTIYALKGGGDTSAGN